MNNIYILNVLTQNIIPLVIGFVVGVITTFGQGWVKDYFTKKVANRNRAQRIIDEIGITTTKVLNEFPINQKIGSPYDQEGYFERCANQLEALKQHKAAKDIREFYELWWYFSENPGNQDTEKYKAKEREIQRLAKSINTYRIG